MSICRNGKFANFVLAVAVLFVQLQPPPVNASERKFTNPASTSSFFTTSPLRCRNRKAKITLWKEMAIWIRNYFKGTGANQTQFSVMGCGSMKSGGDVEPVLYFDGTTGTGFTPTNPDNKAQVILDAQKFVRDFRDNVDGCAKSTVSKLFHQKGDQADAPNVVFYISDCTISGKNNEEMSNLLDPKNSKAFLFLCTKNEAEIREACKKDDGAYRNCWGDMVSWVKSETSIFPFTTRQELNKRLDQVLDTEEVDVANCEYNGFVETNCMMMAKEGCAKVKYPNIIQHPDPPQHGDQCPDNSTTKCEETECPDDDEASTMEPEQAGEATVASESNALVVGVIVGVVVLLLIMVIVVVVVWCAASVRKRRRRSRKVRGWVKKRRKKSKE